MPTLDWLGKDKVVNHHKDVPFRTLVRDANKSVLDSHGTDCGNMIIHGDNLEALKALLPEYEGQVDCIYIDPPYNTGNEGWVYNDNVNDPRIQKWLGEVVGKEGEDFSRHDKWLCMMYPRLKLLSKLLSPTGTIFISIDDNEYANLKLICDEIFGANNNVGTFVWQKRTSPDARKRVSTAHEYLLCYVSDIAQLKESINLLALSDEDKSKYKNPDNDPRGPWTSTDYTAQGFRPNQMYKIVTPGGKCYEPTEGHCWKNTEDEYLRQLDEGRFWFGKDGNGMPRRKTYLSERAGRNIWTWWDNKSVGHTQEATQELTAIFGKKTVFDYPKPTRLIERVIQLSTSSTSIVLDSFAGSGTTAHATMNLNASDGGHRKFILIEMMDYADSVTAERARTVIHGYGEGKKNVAGIDNGFSFYELGPALFAGDASLNKDITQDDLKRYVWYTETKKPFTDLGDEHPYLLGELGTTVYYLAFEPEQETVLDFDLLGALPRRGQTTVVYADRCGLSPEILDELNVRFKQIPRQIARF